MVDEKRTSKLNRILSPFKLSTQALQLIQRADEEPIRREQSQNGKGVRGRFPSTKMGFTLGFDSHKVELPAIMEYEYDPDVLAYWDKPCQLRLVFPHKRNRNFAVLHPMDFLVVRRDGIYFEEWNSNMGFAKRAEQMPSRYVKRLGEGGDEDKGSGRQVWTCPPGEEAAAQYGFGYTLRCLDEINWHLQDNLGYLADYFLAGSLNNLPLDEERVAFALERVRARQGITVEELRAQLDVQFPPGDLTAGRNADTMNVMLLKQKLYVDLLKERLSRPEYAHVFTDRHMSEAYVHLPTTSGWELRGASHTVGLAEGDRVLWDGRNWTIKHVGEQNNVLMDEDGTIVQFPHEALESMVDRGIIQTISGGDHSEIKPGEYAGLTPEGRAILDRAKPAQLHRANENFKFIACILCGEEPPRCTPSQKKQRDRLLAKYKMAEEQYGCGYIGLIPIWENCGRRGSRFDALTEELIAKYIDDYEDISGQTKRGVWSKLVSECVEKGCVPPSEEGFSIRLTNRRGHQQELARIGRVGAYSTEPQWYDISLTTPRHGTHPFHISHLDHTPAEVELICYRNGKRYSLGRCWVSFMIDAFTRRILAVYISYDPPSYRTNMMLIRECVRRFKRLPQVMVVDGGKDFQSVYFEALLARNMVIKKVRPGKKPRNGTVVERVFGTSNTQFFHSLRGNTQLMHNPRQVTDDINPKNLAIWTLPELWASLCEYCYEVYDTMMHPALASSPRDAWRTGINSAGKRQHKRVSYDENFLRDTMPSTPKETAKVTGAGVKINYLYYWHNDMKLPGVLDSDVPVRYDPFNIGIAYVQIRGHWRKCISEQYQNFVGLSEREVAAASAKIRERQRLLNKSASITASQLGTFMRSLDGKQELLVERLQTVEARFVHAVVEGRADYHNLRYEQDGSGNFRPTWDSVVAEPLADAETAVAQIPDLSVVPQPQPLAPADEPDVSENQPQVNLAKSRFRLINKV